LIFCQYICFVFYVIPLFIILFLVYLTMLLFAYLTYFLYSDENLVNNVEEMAWHYAVINSRFEPGLPKKKHDGFLWNNIFTLTPK